MNYVIVNGASSLGVTGLLVQRLPPVARPPMRASIEEIDGVDGSRVAQIGYGAYEKEITIGLKPNCNVDRVIDFFKPSGTITFSNEPDKYYRYDLLTQINFEKLLRFKTATVTIYVQPFKFLLNEPQAEASGGQITVRNRGNAISKPEITIFGNGTVNLALNGMQIFVIEVGNEGYITIDAEILEAFAENQLKNRFVMGDYDNLRLNPGQNTIVCTGNVTKIAVKNISRWI